MTLQRLDLFTRMVFPSKFLVGDGCWQWVGGRNKYGYGVIAKGEGGKGQLKAHRVMYELFVGPIPEGMTVDHECHNLAAQAGECSGGKCLHRLCVRPDHLIPRTVVANSLNGVSPSALNARKTHCLRGHPFDIANTYVAYNGGRYCRACNAWHKRKYKARLLEHMAVTA